ncbi:hypothetical protein HY025_01450 [Candidatus Daviesbacteria bacterium]|nr:hypothetical protein [Candidatus Daviesbacteria bacterium]
MLEAGPPSFLTIRSRIDDKVLWGNREYLLKVVGLSLSAFDNTRHSPMIQLDWAERESLPRLRHLLYSADRARQLEQDKRQAEAKIADMKAYKIVEGLLGDDLRFGINPLVDVLEVLDQVMSSQYEAADILKLGQAMDFLEGVYHNIKKGSRDVAFQPSFTSSAIWRGCFSSKIVA